MAVDVYIGIRSINLPVEGMSCASCILRVEKAIKGVQGVTDAVVNLASEKARIEFDQSRVTLDQLRQAVAGAGYTLVVPDRASGAYNAVTGESPAKQETLKRLKKELILSAVLTMPVMALSMLSMTNWYMSTSPLSLESTNEILFVLTTPVVFISGRRFFKGFWTSARHMTADMNTLVAVGTGAAYLYSTIAVFFPELLGIT